MSEDKIYKISIEGAGLSLNRAVSKEIGEQVVVLLLTAGAPKAHQGVIDPAVSAHAPAQTKHSPASKVQHRSEYRETSIREFLDSCEAKRAPDKITAIGEYLNTQHNQLTFDKNDLVSQFESAAEPVPANISRDLKWTLKAGWIALKKDTKDCYYVTNSGKTAVKQRFSNEIIKKTRRLVPGGNKKASAEQNSED
jgi:hypothetical protein